MVKILILIIFLFICFYLLEKISNKLLGVKKQKLSETEGRKAYNWGQGIIVIVAICMTPFFVIQEFQMFKWFWIIVFLMIFGLKILLEWKYLKNSKQYITTTIFLIITLVLWFNIEFVASTIWSLGENPAVGDPFIIVNKMNNQLAYINHGEIKQTFQVATGKEKGDTPEGLFTVTVKEVEPYYRKTNIAGGSKENPLGTRWIGFDALNTDGRTYGIHGTNDEASIGHYLSAGCVRMKNEEVERLYEEVPLGTKVLIVTNQQSFEELAREAGAIN